MTAPRERCLQDLFEAQASARPDAIALTCEARHLSYGALSRRTSQLARWLRRLGVRAEMRVGLCVERSEALAIGRLGVLKAGGAYVPVDPSDPIERIAGVLRDADVVAIVTEPRAASRVAGLAAARVDLTGDASAISAQPESPPSTGVTAQNLAYVLYTSGSTGRPKGVLMPHAPVVAFAQAVAARLALTPGDRMLQLSAVSFDVVEEELWPVWLRGGAVVTFAGARPTLRELRERVTREQITAIELPTALWQSWVAECERASDVPGTLRLVLMGGERAPAAAVARWHAWGLPLTHVFGLTETAVTTLTCDRTEASGDLPLGRPLANARVHVCGPELAPVASGGTGELYVGGAGLARGYLRQPALTAERFVPDPFAGEPGARLYRTGDRVHRRLDGELLFAGRADAQVKLRGYRIELSEVEAAIARHPRVYGTAVVLRELVPGQPALVAYVAGDVGEEPLRAFLARDLPAYMVPDRVVPLSELPRNANGKVDRRSLPEVTAPLERTRARPAGADEAFAGMWGELLGRGRGAGPPASAGHAEDRQERPS